MHGAKTTERKEPQHEKTSWTEAVRRHNFVWLVVYFGRVSTPRPPSGKSKYIHGSGGVLWDQGGLQQQMECNRNPPMLGQGICALDSIIITWHLRLETCFFLHVSDALSSPLPPTPPLAPSRSISLPVAPARSLLAPSRSHPLAPSRRTWPP